MNGWPDGPGVVDLPDGVRVRGARWRDRRTIHPAPDLALVLLGRAPADAPWPYVWVPWRDFRLPASTDETVAALRAAHERARHERVAVMCGGGVGRTGAALAVLAALAGVPADDVVAWVREDYHPRTVETPWQRRWARTTAAALTP